MIVSRGYMLSLTGCYSVVALLFLTGCATTSAGRSGPIMWEAVDSTVRGDRSRAIHSFTLVLRETEGRSLTFNRMQWDLDPGSSVNLRLPAGGELRLPFQFRNTCMHCDASDGAMSWLTFEFHGEDDTGRPVHLQFTVQPPLAKYIGDLPWVLWEVVHPQDGPVQHFAVEFFADNQTCRDEMDSRNKEQLARDRKKRAAFICLPDNVNPRKSRN